MTFPDISPIAFEIGPLVVRWYALAYVAGILIAQRYYISLTQAYRSFKVFGGAKPGRVLVYVDGKRSVSGKLFEQDNG